MNKASRRLLSGTLIAGVFAAVSAGASPALAQAEEEITLRFLVPQWASTQDRREERRTAFTQIIQSFNEADNGYRIEEVIGQNDAVSNAQALAEGGIDAIWLDWAWYAGNKTNGRIANLDDYASEEELAAFYDWTLDAIRSVDGELGCLWHNTDTPLVFYNTRYVDEPPETWSDVRRIAEEIREEHDKYGMSYPLRLWTQSNIGMFVALGGEVLDGEGRPALFEAGNREILEDMFAFYQGLIEDGLIPAQNAAAGHEDHLPAVYAGDVVMFASNSNAHIRSLQPNIPPDEYEDWAAVPMPRPDAAEQGRYLAGGWFICPVAQEDEAREAAAAAWALHATSQDASTLANNAGGWLPTRPDVFASAEFQSDPIAQIANEALVAGGYGAPMTPDFPILVIALDEAMTSVASGQMTIDEALDAAEQTVLRQFGAN